MNLPIDKESTGNAGDAAPLMFRSMDAAEPCAQETNTEEATAATEVVIDMEQIAQRAREQGMQEALARSEAQMETLVAQERQGVTRALEEFVREKQRYFAGLEREVVRLSLAIAERVLHRESAMDPMLLAGAARVALEQVSHDTDAVLRVSPEQVGAWEQTMRKEGRIVQVKPDANLTRGECLLETASGTVELGVRAQLQEIEHGFFELLRRNPAMAV